MDLHKLKVLCKVIELKSFTRAAQALFLSQPTISEHVRALEEECGQPLLNRLGREIRPTEAGQILASYGSKIIRLEQEAVQALEQYSGRLAGHLQIGAGTIPGAYILPQEIARFKQQFPDITINLRITGSKTIAKEILAGDLELGIIGARWPEPGLHWQQLFQDQLVLAVSTDHPWAGRAEVELRELQQEPFIQRDPSSGTRHVLSQLLKKHHINPEQLPVVAEMGTTEAVRQSIKANIGISILSARAVADDVTHGTLAVVAIKGVEMVRPFYLVSRRNQPLSPLALAFFKALQNQGLPAGYGLQATGPKKIGP